MRHLICEKRERQVIDVMIISHSKKFVFVHIFKTAGTSVRDVVLPYARLIDKIAFHFVLTRKAIGFYARITGRTDEGQSFITGIHKHATALDLSLIHI